jgi:hypothetical protein
MGRERSVYATLVIVMVVGVLGGCDLPTEPPSFQTDTTVKTPLMEDKAFGFLGGPESTYDPLIDTTRVEVDSLFADAGEEGTVVVNRAFTHHNEIAADLSGLEGLTDSTENVVFGSAPLQIEYTNEIPLDFDVRVTVLDEAGEPIVTIPTNRAVLPLGSAVVADDGTTAEAREGQIRLDLETKTVQSLGRGETLRVRLTGIPRDQGPPARVRSDDILHISLSANIETSIRVGGG